MKPFNLGDCGSRLGTKLGGAGARRGRVSRRRASAVETGRRNSEPCRGLLKICGVLHLASHRTIPPASGTREPTELAEEANREGRAGSGPFRYPLEERSILFSTVPVGAQCNRLKRSSGIYARSRV